MKRILPFTLFVLSSLFLFGCNRSSSDQNDITEKYLRVHEDIAELEQYINMIKNAPINTTNEDDDELELIIVCKTPRGAYAEVNDPSDFPGISWYDVGLSKNGKEPIEYIWRAMLYEPNSYAILNAEIGDRGTIFLRDWAEKNKIKLCLPNTEKPPVVGMLGEVYWRTSEPILLEKGDFVLRFPFVETDSQEMFLYKYQGKDKNVIIPSDLNIIEIDSRAFTESGVVSVTIPEGVKRLRRESFAYCRDLTTIILPSSVTSIAESAFDNCGNLAEIIVNENNSAYSSREGVLFNKNKTTLIKYPEGKLERAYTIPKGVTTIESRAFDNCKNITSIIMPDGVTSINNAAFRGCSRLTSISIPSTVKNIGRAAFYFCESLSEITIPVEVMAIGNGAFAGCLNLTSVTLSRKTHVEKNAFPDTARIIYVD